MSSTRSTAVSGRCRAPAGEYDYTYAIFIEEGLRTGMFRDRWIEVWPDDFYVSLYDETGQAP